LLHAAFGPRLATSGYFHPGASLSLLLYQDVKGTFTPKLSNMLGTHKNGRPLQGGQTTGEKTYSLIADACACRSRLRYGVEQLKG